MGRIIIVLAIIVIAYWYWSGPNDYSAETSPVDDPKKNAQIIADCVANGNFSQTDSYKGGIADEARPSRALCYCRLRKKSAPVDGRGTNPKDTNCGYLSLDYLPRFHDKQLTAVVKLS